LIYGSILIFLTSASVLTYKYLQNSPNEVSTTELDNNYVYQAILDGNTEIYRKYIDDGGDLSFAYLQGSEKGRTPLEILIDKNDLEYAQKLMDNGFDLNLVDNNHIDTITNIVAYNKDFNIELINNIAITLVGQIQDELEEPDTYGYSLLINVITTDNQLLVTEILKYVNDINQVYQGETALTYACGIGFDNLDVIQELVEKGADINYQGKAGYNCLMNSVMFAENDTVITYLLTLPSLEIDAVNDFGQTALHLCVEYTNTGAIDILLQNSTINRSIKDEDDLTAKDYANFMKNLHPEVLDYEVIFNKL